MENLNTLRGLQKDLEKEMETIYLSDDIYQNSEKLNLLIAIQNYLNRYE